MNSDMEVDNQPNVYSGQPDGSKIGSMFPEDLNMGIRMLPPELLSRIFSYINSDTIYGKFIEPYGWTDLSYIQDIAYTALFSRKLIVRSFPTRKRGYDSSRVFYSAKDLNSSFVIVGFKRGYDVLRTLIYFNLDNQRNVIPPEIGFLFSFKNEIDNDSDLPSPKLYEEVEYFTKLIEILSFDNYYRQSIPCICIQLSYNVIITPELVLRSNKIMQKIEALEKKTTKIMIQSSFTSRNSIQNIRPLHPAPLDNLEELYLLRCSISNYHLKHYLRNLFPSLKVLDLTANEITSLQNFVIPASLERLNLGANNLTSLKGPNYCEATHLYALDASINGIDSLDYNLRLPPALKSLKITYNSIPEIHQAQISNSLEIIGLSKNALTSLEDISLPESLKELHLNGNSIKTFPDGFFLSTPNLTILDVSENQIDDLDDLGQLPQSLSELMLDNNEIDYSDLNNILTSCLTKLSMRSTGLITFSDVQLPKHLKELDLSKNEIGEIELVNFGDELVKLNLSNNLLTTFNLDSSFIQIPQTLRSLDISSNHFERGLRSIGMPPNLTSLKLNDVGLGVLSNELMSQLPRTLTTLHLDHTCWTAPSNSQVVNTIKYKSIEPLINFEKYFPNLKTLTLERNCIGSIDSISYPCQLESLSYEYNDLIYINFKNIPTNIHYLVFNNNKIDEAKLWESIGSVPYFPNIEYFGICGDQTKLMKSGLFFGRCHNAEAS
ncbi:uncharacterized protein RJT20DRAFT_126768 [Scheffersomyces xylosifermentans]|uniref:uncharacterized protein n=1 Tax=Scheffersomyces xylosifermentans TaxID=1304137 RepID=UPI00315D3C70